MGRGTGKGAGKGDGRGDGSGGMLSAKKKRLEASVREDLVNFQNSELEYFYNNYASIGTMAAIIAGFAFSAVAVEEDDLTGKSSFVDSTVIISLYYGLACTAMGASMVTLITTTLLNIYGTRPPFPHWHDTPRA